LLCFILAVCFSISTVPLNAEISQCSQEGRHGESVAPDAGVGNDAEEFKVGLVIKPQEGNAD
jgi:hypothetical protein